MRTYLQLTVLFVALLLAASSAFARVGGIGDGGGHGYSSTPAEVRAYLQTPDPKKGKFVYDWSSVYQHLDAWLALSPEYAPNPVIKKVLTAMKKMPPGKTAYDFIYTTPLSVSDACYDQNGALSDGATTIGKLGAPICFNVNSLARYPADELKRELWALVFHEWTHQLGFGEPEAVEMQNYVKHLLPVVSAMLDEASGEMPIRVGGVRKLTAQDGTSLSILCTTPEIWRNSEKGGNVFKSTSAILFVGQSFEVRGQWYGDVNVACSDLPEFDCVQKPSTDKYCHGDYVYLSEGDNNGVCIGHFLDDKDPPEWGSLQELKEAKICK